MALSTTVVVVTLDRPKYLRKCLELLHAQTHRPDQIIVVDASKNDLTRKAVEGFPGVLYLRNESGAGRMTQSRNIGILKATGDIIAFIDDDSNAEPNWMENLLKGYNSAEVGAVGGRVMLDGRFYDTW